MNKEFMARMSASELDEYAKALGIPKLGYKTAEDKITALEKRREKKAVVRVAGLELEIPIKVFHSKEVTAILSKPNSTDADCEKALLMLVGDEQMAEIEKACTDDDGTYDVNALAYIFTKIITSPKLKNF